MKLIVIGSSSKGNCYILDNGNESLIIEAGMPFEKVMKYINFDIMRIKGCIISHEHGDHSKYVKKYIKYMVPCYMSAGTKAALGIEDINCISVKELNKYSLGGFTFIPFKVQHDASEPYGYLINHIDTGLVLFATDTYFLSYTFPGLNNIIIECNYHSERLINNLNAGLINPKLYARTLKSHCSLETCIDILKANDLSQTNNIVLIHLSDANSDEVLFKTKIKEEIGKTVVIAKPDLTIDFNKIPF